MMAWDAFNILFVATAATAATERVLNAGLCAGARRVRFRYVHVPKSGGMTLTCTLDSEYRRGLLPCHQLKNFHVPVELEARHRTYDEYLLEAGAIGAADDGAVGGASAAVPIDADGVCLPLITMLAPPVKRFLSAFYHRPPESKRARYKTCYFLACRAGSTLMKANMAGALSADEFALWPHAEDVEAGHNMATKYLGARRLYYGANGYGRMTVDGKRDLVPGADASWRPIHTVVLRNDTEGRAALARAKRRLAAMAFVGLVERFDESLALLEHRVGFRVPGQCVCNINPFKRLGPASMLSSRDTRAGGELSAAARERIERDNSLDAELHAYASGLFARSYHATFGGAKPGESSAITTVASGPRFDHSGLAVIAPRFECDRNATYCELAGEHQSAASARLVTAAQYLKTSIGRGRVARGEHNACVYACARTERTKRKSRERREAERYALTVGCVGLATRRGAQDPVAHSRYQSCLKQSIAASMAGRRVGGVD